MNLNIKDFQVMGAVRHTRDAQVLSLLVSHSPAQFWLASMDTSKESKKRANSQLGGKKEGLLRILLTDEAYDEKSSRAALCGACV